MKPRRNLFLGSLALRTLPAGALAALLASQSAKAADISWASSVEADDNWSTPVNWSGTATPEVSDDITFTNIGGATGTTVTSIVDTSYPIDSLNFLQDNTVNHTLSISDGQTLTVAGSFTPTSGEATAVLFGQPNVSGTTVSTTNTTGLGTFTVNSAANHFLVGYANASGTVTAAVNMSGLRNFNATVDIFGVGRKGTISTDASRQQAGNLTLAKNNTITANEISVGSTTHISGTTGTHNNGGTSTLNLGSGGNAVNNLYADRMSFGIGKATGYMNFTAGGVATDTVTIRAKDMAASVGTFEIGIRNMSSSSGTPSGTVNFGAGKVDALITTLNVGQWANGAGNSGVNPVGTFTTGTNANSSVTVTTLNLANSGSSTTAATRIVTGNLNVTGGVFSATTVNMATGNATTGLTKTANLTVDGGTFRFGTFGAPTGTNAVAINFNSGTVSAIDGTGCALGLAYNLGKAGGGTTVAFGQATGGTGTIALSGAGSLLGNTTVETVKDTTVGGAIGGAFSLTKTGAATLIISENQTYSGGTIINDGTIKMSANKTFAFGRNMSVGAAGTWLLDGTSQTLGELTGTGLVTSAWGTIDFDTLTVGSGDVSSEFGGTIAGGDGASVRGIKLDKTGAGTLTLTNTNTYKGTTAINAGTLKLGASGSITNSSAVTIAAGATLDTTAQASYSIAGTQTLTFGLNAADAGSSGQIHAAGLDIAAATVAFDISGTLNDAAYVLATYNVGTLTGAAFASVPTVPGYTINYAYNGGTQIALVPSAATSYSGWAAANANNEAANLDSDNDGVDNGVEYFMGQTGPTFTASPSSFTGNTATWTNGGNIPAGQYGTQFVIQTSPDLVNWTPILADNPNLNNQAGSVSFTLTGSGKQFVRLVVTPN